MPVAAQSLAERVRPPLKWAGGKRWQIPHLKPLWQPHSRRRLVEPFCGGLAVALVLQPDAALLNDANPHLINFYRWLKKGLEVSAELRNDEATFYRQREEFNSLLRDGQAETARAASLFYYLNRTGYNGLCRFNSRGEFNVPFGQYERISYVSEFHSYRGAFENWEFTVGDFASLKLRKTDFVYADPPYDVEFTAFSQGGFNWDDQVRTAEVLARHSGPVVLVNQATDRIRTLYRGLGYDTSYLDAPRRISCNGDRTPAREIVATKNL
jgi:DNA adenine methylase